MTRAYPFHKWLGEQDERRKREARIFISGFWTGFAPGLLMCFGCVILALYLRG